MKATESIIIDGYDLLAENDRLAFEDQTVCGRTINRGTATVSTEGTPHPDYEDIKKAHEENILPNTLTHAESPVIDFSYPVAGMFVDSAVGTYLDLYQGSHRSLFANTTPPMGRAFALFQKMASPFDARSTPTTSCFSASP